MPIYNWGLRLAGDEGGEEDMLTDICVAEGGFGGVVWNGGGG